MPQVTPLPVVLGLFAALLLSTPCAAAREEGQAPGAPVGAGEAPQAPVVTDLSQLDALPRRLTPQNPVYPVALRALGVAGKVETMFIIEKDGSVSNFEILNSSDSRFNAATTECVVRWRYEPARKGGVPVRVRVRVPVIFRFED